MRILHISDTHGRHGLLKQMPAADVIIHSGDITEYGTEEEVFSFVEWFESLDYRYKVFIPGNHDICLYYNRIEGLEDGMFFLDNCSITIDGVKIYGGFLGNFNDIPFHTDVLVTHTPPLGILDGFDTHYGDSLLLEKVFQIKPRLHLFGHIHESYGTEFVDGVMFSNASSSEVYNVFDI